LGRGGNAPSDAIAWTCQTRCCSGFYPLGAKTHRQVISDN
jgi:hypothetical protein